MPSHVHEVVIEMFRERPVLAADLRRNAGPTPIFAALLTALEAVDRDHADLYNDLVCSVLSAAARDRLEEFLTAPTSTSSTTGSAGRRRSPRSRIWNADDGHRGPPSGRPGTGRRS